MNPDQIFRGLLSRGLPEHIAAGFMDNFAAESGFDPSINERNPVVPGSRGGRGLYQLTGPRRKSYESQYGTNYDVDSQLDFLMSELSGPESKAWAAISATPDRAEATRAISRAFLRPGHDNSAARVGMWGGGGTDKLAGGLSIQPGKGEDRLMEQDQKKGLLGGIFGDPEKRAMIGMALSGMAFQPNRGMQAALQMKAQSARDDKTMNKTVQWLVSQGREDLAQAVQSGAIDGRTAAGIAYQQPKDDRTALMKNVQWIMEQNPEIGMDQAMQIAKGGTTVNNNFPAQETELRKKLSGEVAKVWGGYLESGNASAANLQDFEVLGELVNQAPTGPVQGRIAEMFPGVDSASAAFNSIVKRIAPTLRAPGSGSTSDIEYEGMLQGLPALRNKPEANRVILEVMKAKADLNIKRAEIVNEFNAGRIDRDVATTALNEIDRVSIMTPEMRALLGSVSTDGAAPDGGGWVDQDGVKIRLRP